MSLHFDYFIVFAEMRTGSNFLETNLNALSGVTCFGEAFNPHFIGYPNKTEVLEISQTMRDNDPESLITAIKEAPGILGGFRYFHDHDPRVLDIAVKDPRCAKIILTRNPLDSYVSWKIAKETGQWKLTNITRRKEAQARFDPEEFARHVEALQDFQVYLLNSLQRSGQTPFYIAYEDLQDVEVMNGMAAWLGVEDRLPGLVDSLKRQNPSPVTTKVINVEEMIEALGGLDRFNLTRTPNFEPRRGPAVPTYVTGAVTPLMYLPVRGSIEDDIRQWMADIDGVPVDALAKGLNQKQMRQWMKGNEGHRRFTVLRHPLARAHSAFCTRILNKGPGCYTKIRNTLRRRFNLPIPEGTPDARYTRSDHREAFEAFLEFLRMNIAGQTPIRVDGSWCTQAQAISCFASFASPDYVYREDEISEQLPALARRYGHDEPPAPNPTQPDSPFSLEDIYDEDLETLAADIYQRDYATFGFGPWRKA